MKRRIVIGLILAFTLALFTAEAGARAFRVAQIPNGNVDGCGACHNAANAGGPRNAFGIEIQQNFLSPPGGAFGSVVWGAALAGLDSDGDGVDNGTELNDPNGTWQQGNTNPGNPNDVTNPGVVDTSPPTPVPALSMLGIALLVVTLCGLTFLKIREPELAIRSDSRPRRR